jgi:hypothetical protein
LTGLVVGAQVGLVLGAEPTGEPSDDFPHH